MSWDSFRAIPNETEIFNHGYSECVALANHYHENFLGGTFVPVQSAYQWWTEHWPQLATYTRSPHPVTGSLAVWDARWGNGHGHIGIVTGVLPDGRFTTIEQNAGQGRHRYVNRYTRSIGGVLGFLVPNPNPATTNNSGDQMPIDIEGVEEMRLWIAVVKGTWYLIVPTGNGKPNGAVLPGDSGMGGKGEDQGARQAGIPVITFSSVDSLKRVANV